MDRNFQSLTLPLVISQFFQELKLTYHQRAQVSQGNHEFIKRKFSSACWFVLSSVWLFLLLPQQQVDTEHVVLLKYCFMKYFLVLFPPEELKRI